ncbi:MAG: thioredoxin family protein [Bacteroidetes bacterium]|nr:thioredoxin family protein [Bacteroidota bacterium]
MSELNILEEIQSKTATALYFKGDRCSVCSVLEPKIKALLEIEFSKFSFISVPENEGNNELTAQLRVFNVPTLVLFLEGKEFLRTGKNTSIMELAKQIRRPYDICFA